MFVAIIQSAITIVTSAPCLPYYDLFIWFALTCRFSTEVQFYRQASHFPRVSVPPPDFSLSLFPEDGTSRLKAFSSFSFFKSHTQIHTRKKITLFLSLCSTLIQPSCLLSILSSSTSTSPPSHAAPLFSTMNRYI